MSSRSQDNSWILIPIIIFAVLVVAGVWKFSEVVGVDPQVGAEVIGKIIAYFMILGGTSYALRNTFDIKNIFLILFPFSLFCITPILDFKAHSGLPSFIQSSVNLPWWGTGWGQAAIFLILSAISALIWYFTRDE